MKATKRNKQIVKEDLSRRKKHQVLYTTYLKKIRPFLFLLQIDRIFPGVFRDWFEEFFRRILKAFPLTNPFLTFGG